MQSTPCLLSLPFNANQHSTTYDRYMPYCIPYALNFFCQTLGRQINYIGFLWSSLRLVCGRQQDNRAGSPTERTMTTSDNTAAKCGKRQVHSNLQRHKNFPRVVCVRVFRVVYNVCGRATSTLSQRHSGPSCDASNPQNSEGNDKESRGGELRGRCHLPHAACNIQKHFNSSICWQFASFRSARR